MINEDLKTLLTNKQVNETIQLVAVAIAVAFVLFQIPSCSKEDSINKTNQDAAVKIAAIEAGLVQKTVKRAGTSYTDTLWVKPEKEEIK